MLQQQLEKHCSAVAHPHGLSMQGKGRERSLSASRLAAEEPVGAGDPAKGSGTPETTSTYAASMSQLTARDVKLSRAMRVRLLSSTGGINRVVQTATATPAA